MKMRLPRGGRTWALMASWGLGLLAGCGSPTAPVAEQSARPTTDATHADAPRADAPHVAEAVLADERAAATSEVGIQLAAYTDAAKSKKGKFDPVAINGKYFEGWKKPKLALVISGRQDGYFEPCGCAGIEEQKGGMSRRHTLIKQLTDQGWPVAAVDVGGLVRRFGRQAEIKFAVSAEALRKMGYGAVGFGPSDLRLSVGEIVAAVAGSDPKDTIFVSANVDLLGLTPKTRVLEAGGLKLGVTSVLGKEYQQQVNNAEVVIQPAADSLKTAMPELADCDVRVLLAYTTMAEAKQLSQQFPEFDLIVCADGREVPPQQPEKLAGKTRLVEVSPKAMYVTVAGFYDDARQPVRFQRVALDSRFGDSSDMKQLMANYQQQLEQLGWDGLGLKSVSHPKAKPGDKLAGQFASAASCKECHPTAWNVWSKSKHAHATETLTKLDPPRQYDPECISCHSTGWNPTEFFAYSGGFDSVEKTPQLAGNSCENCHGPGAAHVAAEKGRNAARKQAERDAIKLTVAFARDNICQKCHDHDNSPKFTEKDKATGRDNFEVYYWPKVEHKGKK